MKKQLSFLEQLFLHMEEMLVEHSLQQALDHDYDETKRVVDQHMEETNCDGCPMDGKCVIQEIHKGTHSSTQAKAFN